MKATVIILSVILLIIVGISIFKKDKTEDKPVDIKKDVAPVILRDAMAVPQSVSPQMAEYMGSHSSAANMNVGSAEQVPVANRPHL